MTEDLISVHRSHAEVQVHSGKRSLWNPTNDRKQRERNEHHARLPQRRPTLFLHVNGHLVLHSVLFNNLPRGEGASVQWRLRNQTAAGRQSQYGAREDGKSQAEEIPMIRRRFLKVVLRRLREDARDVVIDEEQKIQHECWEEGGENSPDADAIDGVDDPSPSFSGFVNGGLPIPRSDDIDALNSIHVHSGEEASMRLFGLVGGETREIMVHCVSPSKHAGPPRVSKTINRHRS